MRLAVPPRIFRGEHGAVIPKASTGELVRLCVRLLYIRKRCESLAVERRDGAQFREGHVVGRVASTLSGERFHENGVEYGSTIRIFWIRRRATIAGIRQQPLRVWDLRRERQRGNVRMWRERERENVCNHQHKKTYLHRLVVALLRLRKLVDGLTDEPADIRTSIPNPCLCTVDVVLRRGAVPRVPQTAVDGARENKNSVGIRKVLQQGQRQC